MNIYLRDHTWLVAPVGTDDMRLFIHTPELGNLGCIPTEDVSDATGKLCVWHTRV